MLAIKKPMLCTDGKILTAETALYCATVPFFVMWLFMVATDSG
ncbi:MAG: hypothetical protein RLZZ69_3745, partial [Cyanobacteriota bacterium]